MNLQNYATISCHCLIGYGIAYGLRQKVTAVLIVRVL